MTSVFSSLHESLQQVLSQRSGWSELREVQEKACAAVSAGGDVLIIAPTAGGKSEAALIPVMDGILRHGWTGVSCLYIAPLKALINDQEERFSAFCTPASLAVAKWHGDVPKGDRSWKGEPPHFLLITPESLEVILREPDLAGDLRQVRFIIVDELHAFVETDRGVQLKVLLDRMDTATGRKIQRIGLSATMGNPEEILGWFSDGRHGASLVAVPPEPREKQFRFIVEPEDQRRIDAIAGAVAGRKALVFVESRSGAEHLAHALSGRVRNLHIHHSSLPSGVRRAAEEAFLSGEACIICTSTLELGIDIGNLDVVVQVGPPDSVSSFLQRMGRSGRRNRPASVVWVLEDPCALLCCCAIIECAMERVVEDLHPPERPCDVLLQQLFLSLLRPGRESGAKIRTELLSRPAFAGIGRDLYDRILEHLVGEDFVAADGGILMPGTGAERVLGRSNWKELFSVIAGGGEYRAMTPEGEMVGMLDARFVSSREGGEVTLGGRTWRMVRCDEGHNIVVVVPAGTAGMRTFWTGSGGREFSSLICRKVQQIRKRGGSVLPLGGKEKEILHSALSALPDGIGRQGLYILERREPGRRGVIVFSLHGSRFNRVLALLLRHFLGGKARTRYTDFSVAVTGAGAEGAAERVVAALEGICDLSEEETGALLPLPPREGWKFAGLLPDDLFAAAVLSDYYRLREFRKEIRSLEICRIPGQALPVALQRD